MSPKHINILLFLVENKIQQSYTTLNSLSDEYQNIKTKIVEEIDNLFTIKNSLNRELEHSVFNFEPDLLTILKERGKIDAIRFYKKMTGDTLVESKNLVENFMEKHNVGK